MTFSAILSKRSEGVSSAYFFFLVLVAIFESPVTHGTAPSGTNVPSLFGTDVWYLSIDHAATTRIVPKPPSPIRMVRRDAKRQQPTRRGSAAGMGMIDPQRLTTMLSADYVGTLAECMATVPNASLRTSMLTSPASAMSDVSSSTVRNPCTDSGR